MADIGENSSGDELDDGKFQQQSAARRSLRGAIQNVSRQQKASSIFAKFANRFSTVDVTPVEESRGSDSATSKRNSTGSVDTSDGPKRSSIIDGAEVLRKVKALKRSTTIHNAAEESFVENCAAQPQFSAQLDLVRGLAKEITVDAPDHADHLCEAFQDIAKKSIGLAHSKLGNFVEEKKKLEATIQDLRNKLNSQTQNYLQEVSALRNRCRKAIDVEFGEDERYFWDPMDDLTPQLRSLCEDIIVEKLKYLMSGDQRTTLNSFQQNKKFVEEGMKEIDELKEKLATMERDKMESDRRLVELEKSNKSLYVLEQKLNGEKALWNKNMEKEKSAMKELEATNEAQKKEIERLTLALQEAEVNLDELRSELQNANSRQESEDGAGDVPKQSTDNDPSSKGLLEKVKLLSKKTANSNSEASTPSSPSRAPVDSSNPADALKSRARELKKVPGFVKASAAAFYVMGMSQTIPNSYGGETADDRPLVEFPDGTRVSELAVGAIVSRICTIADAALERVNQHASNLERIEEENEASRLRDMVSELDKEVDRRLQEDLEKQKKQAEKHQKRAERHQTGHHQQHPGTHPPAHHQQHPGTHPPAHHHSTAHHTAAHHHQQHHQPQQHHHHHHSTAHHTTAHHHKGANDTETQRSAVGLPAQGVFLPAREPHGIGGDDPQDPGGGNGTPSNSGPGAQMSANSRAYAEIFNSVPDYPDSPSNSDDETESLRIQTNVNPDYHQSSTPFEMFSPQTPSGGNSQQLQQMNDHLQEIQEMRDRHKVEIEGLHEMLEAGRQREAKLEQARDEARDRMAAQTGEHGKLENRFRILKDTNAELKSKLTDLEGRVDLDRRAKERALDDLALIKRQAEDKAKQTVQAMDCFLHPAQVAKIKAKLRNVEHEHQALMAENDALRSALEMFRQKILEVPTQQRNALGGVLEHILNSTGRSVYQRLYEDAVRRMAALGNLFDSLRLSPSCVDKPPHAEQLRASSMLSNSAPYGNNEYFVSYTDDESPKVSRRSVSCPPISLDMIHSMHTKNAESLSTMRDEALIPTEGVPEMPEFPTFVRLDKVKSLKTPTWLQRSAAKHLGQFRHEVLLPKGVQPGASPSPAPTGSSPAPAPTGRVLTPSPSPPSSQMAHAVHQADRVKRKLHPVDHRLEGPERPVSVPSVHDSAQSDLNWEDTLFLSQSSFRERRYSHGSTRHGHSQTVYSNGPGHGGRDAHSPPRSQTPNPTHRSKDPGRAFFSRRRQVFDETPRPRSVNS